MNPFRSRRKRRVIESSPGPESSPPPEGQDASPAVHSRYRTRDTFERGMVGDSQQREMREPNEVTGEEETPARPVSTGKLKRVKKKAPIPEQPQSESDPGFITVQKTPTPRIGPSHSTVMSRTYGPKMPETRKPPPFKQPGAHKSKPAAEQEEEDEEYAKQLGQMSQVIQQEQDEEEEEQVPVTPEEEDEWPLKNWDRAKTRTKYEELLNQGHYALARHILMEDRRHDVVGDKRPGKDDEVTDVTAVLQIMVTVEEGLLHSLNSRTLFEDLLDPNHNRYKDWLPSQDPKFEQIKSGDKKWGKLGKADEVEAPRPGLYCHSHVNSKTGKPPTKNDYLKILDTIEQYAEGFEETFRLVQWERKNKTSVARSTPNAWDRFRLTPPQQRKLDKYTQLAVDIDTMQRHDLNRKGLPQAKYASKEQWEADHWAKGRRRYLSTEPNIKGTRLFLLQQRAICRRIPDRHADDALPWALFEVGWSIEPFQRMENHRLHVSSLPLMNLIDATTRYLERNHEITPDPPGTHYRMKGCLLFECWKPEQSPAGEHFFTRLTHGYTWQAGMNNEVAGRSNASAMSASVKAYKTIADRLNWQVIGRRTKAEFKRIEDATKQTEGLEELEAIKSKLPKKQGEVEEAEREGEDLQRAIEEEERKLDDKINEGVRLFEGVVEDGLNIDYQHQWLEAIGLQLRDIVLDLQGAEIAAAFDEQLKDLTLEPSPAGVSGADDHGMYD